MMKSGHTLGCRNNTSSVVMWLSSIICFKLNFNMYQMYYCYTLMAAISFSIIIDPGLCKKSCRKGLKSLILNSQIPDICQPNKSNQWIPNTQDLKDLKDLRSFGGRCNNTSSEVIWRPCSIDLSVLVFKIHLYCQHLLDAFIQSD